MPAAAVFAPGSSALITGGASGVGLAIAKLCRSKGMKILLVDVNAEALQTAKKQLVGENDAAGSDVVTAAADVSKAHAWTELSKTAASTFRTIELLVLNAGVGMRGTWGDDEYFNKVCPLTARASSPPTDTRRHRFFRRTFLASSTELTPSCLWFRKLPRRGLLLLSLREVSRASRIRRETRLIMHPSLL